MCWLFLFFFSFSWISSSTYDFKNSLILWMKSIQIMMRNYIHMLKLVLFPIYYLQLSILFQMINWVFKKNTFIFTNFQMALNSQVKFISIFFIKSNYEWFVVVDFLLDNLDRLFFIYCISAFNKNIEINRIKIFIIFILIWYFMQLISRMLPFYKCISFFKTNYFFAKNYY